MRKALCDKKFLQKLVTKLMIWQLQLSHITIDMKIYLLRQFIPFFKKRRLYIHILSMLCAINIFISSISRVKVSSFIFFE